MSPIQEAQGMLCSPLLFIEIRLSVDMTYGYTHRGRTFIDILDDESLLNIFHHCRPVLLLDRCDDEDSVFRDFLVLAGGVWEQERWWYKLVQVCRRWRHLILASPSYLGLSLICMPGTPVADMLAHSPPFPLTIDHLLTNFNTDDDIATEDEEGILLALERRDRVRR